MIIFPMPIDPTGPLPTDNRSWWRAVWQGAAVGACAAIGLAIIMSPLLVYGHCKPSYPELCVADWRSAKHAVVGMVWMFTTGGIAISALTKLISPKI